MARRIELGEIVEQFPVYQSDGYTKQSGETVFTATLWKDGAVSAVSVAIAEIGTSGEYTATFTPDGVGFWALEVLVDYNKVTYAETFDVIAEDAKAWVNVSYDDDATTLYMETWLERAGSLIPQGSLVSTSVSVYNQAGTLEFTETSSSPKADGRFALTHVISLTADRPYNVNVTVTDNIGAVTTVHALTTVE